MPPAAMWAKRTNACSKASCRGWCSSGFAVSIWNTADGGAEEAEGADAISVIAGGAVAGTPKVE
jgi:hypothetical protein